MLASPSAFRLVAILALVSLVACSLPRTSPVLPSANTGSFNEVRPGISGVIKTTNWIVKKGQTVKVTGTLAVFATGNITIDGNLLVAPNATLGLFAKKTLKIGGKIEPASTKADFKRPNGANSYEIDLDGDNLLAIQGVVSGLGDAVNIAADVLNGQVYIGGFLTAPDGAAGTSAATPGSPGGAQPGADVSIGTGAAIASIEKLAKKYDPSFSLAPGVPKLVTIRGHINAGNGGNGYSDVNGHAVGNDQVLVAGEGATGGNLSITAGEIDLYGSITPGYGGYGGEAGFNPLTGAKFSVNMYPGRNLVATLGNGANSGTVTIVGKFKGTPDMTGGGWAGDLEYAHAGDGAPTKPGGTTTITTGIPGLGSMYRGKRFAAGEDSFAELSGGGNGGASNVPTKPGGPGGDVKLLGGGAAPAVLWKAKSTINGYSSGALGYNGCPTMNGTDGGFGAELNIIRSDFNAIKTSFNGGDGGNGVSPGNGGDYGTDAKGGALGHQGKKGNDCGPFATYTFPIYLYGQRIASWILGGAVPHGVRSHSVSGDLWFTGQGSNPPAGLGEITTTGAITMYTSGFTSSDHPNEIVQGPDGNLWFTNYASFGSGAGSIGRMTTTGTIARFSSGLTEHPQDITAGPDGNLWFTESATYPTTGKIGRISTSGTIMEYSTGLTNHAAPSGIALGPDNNLWFADTINSAIGQITTNGTIMEFTGLTGSPQHITAGPDGRLWFTESGPPVKIGSVTTTGTVTEYSTGISSSATSLSGITAGPLSSIWFLECGSLKLGQITTTGTVTETAIPNITTNGIPLGGITQGPDGNIWFVETNNQAIVKYTPSGALKPLPKPKR